MRVKRFLNSYFICRFLSPDCLLSTGIKKNQALQYFWVPPKSLQMKSICVIPSIVSVTGHLVARGRKECEAQQRIVGYQHFCQYLENWCYAPSTSRLWALFLCYV